VHAALLMVFEKQCVVAIVVSPNSQHIPTASHPDDPWSLTSYNLPSSVWQSSPVQSSPGRGKVHMSTTQQPAVGTSVDTKPCVWESGQALVACPRLS